MDSKRVSQKRSRMVMACAFSLLVLPLSLSAMTVQELDQKVETKDTTYYSEFFKQVLYQPFVHLLRFDYLVNRLLQKEHPALDVTIYDEIPNSGFFENRHGANRMTVEALQQGPSTGQGPDLGGPWTVLKGKLEGVSTGLFIEDAKGERYLLKFDPKSNPEMATAAEVIAHKFFYAMGYHTAEYYLVEFDPEVLQVHPNATYYNEDGFKVPLTQDALLSDLISRVPKMAGGKIRASASKLLPEPLKGYMPFSGRRDDDPEDLIPHEDRRSIRALTVFGSWLNHYDLREGNTMDVIVSEDGEAHVKHYLIDFGSTLGSAAYRAKYPVAGYEHIVDWYEIGRAIPTLKVVEKDWERKWDAMNRRIPEPELGYFDNFYFEPNEWKTQLPYEVFDRLTKADAFWASKIIMKFTNEEIAAIVATGDYSDEEDTRQLTNILINRRDIIGRYWFSKVTPLDQFTIKRTGADDQIAFKDLSVEYGFFPSNEAQYRYRIKRSAGKEPVVFTGTSFSLPSAQVDSKNDTVLQIQVKRKDSDWSEPAVQLSLVRNPDDGDLRIAAISHQDF